MVNKIAIKNTVNIKEMLYLELPNTERHNRKISKHLWHFSNTADIPASVSDYFFSKSVRLSICA